MRKHFLIYFIVALCAFSCKSKVDQGSTEQGINFFNYSIDIRGSSVPLYDQIESLELLGLEESDESLIKPNIKIFDYEKGYVVVNEEEGTVFLFNSDGTFKSKFNRKGQGPEEYPYMHHTQYRDGIIETYVENAQKLMTYDLDGNFIKSLKLPYPAVHVFHFNNGYLLGMGNQIEYDSVGHDVIFTDEQMNPLRFAMPFDKPNGVPLPAPHNEFRFYNNKVLFNPFWTDSVYQINKGQVSPFIHFDFGDEWLWDEVPLSREFNATIIDKTKKVWAYTWVIGKDRIEITYMTSFEEPPGMGYIDRRTGEFFNYKYDWYKNQRLPFLPLRFEEGKLLAVFLADELSDSIESIGSENVITRGALSKEQILASENPVLVWIKFR